MKHQIACGLSILVSVVLTLQPLYQINSHTYTVGVSNFVFECGCYLISSCIAIPYIF